MVAARKQPENLDAYMELGRKEIVRLVLLLLVEEGLQRQLAIFRADDLATDPAKDLEELGDDGDDAGSVCNRAG